MGAVNGLFSEYEAQNEVSFYAVISTETNGVSEMEKSPCATVILSVSEESVCVTLIRRDPSASLRMTV